VPLNNFEEMSDRLLELAADPDKRKTFGARARENVKRFLPNEVFKEWDELFRNLYSNVD
jgi:glycosyltransferase involved in cell wall biosynthesis